MSQPAPDQDWAWPPEQPATGPLRRKLGEARGLLYEVLDAARGEGPLPSAAAIEAVLAETIDLGPAEAARCPSCGRRPLAWRLREPGTLVADCQACDDGLSTVDPPRIGGER